MPSLALGCIETRSPRAIFLDDMWLFVMPLFFIVALSSAYVLLRIRSRFISSVDIIRLVRRHAILLATISLLTLLWFIYNFLFVVPNLSEQRPGVDIPPPPSFAT